MKRSRKIFICLALFFFISLLILLMTAKFTSSTTATTKQPQQDGKDTTTFARHTVESKSTLPSGYIVVNRFAGQQGTLVRGIGSLQCLAASFSLPVRIMQPFAVGSSFTSNLRRSEVSAALQFGDFFDLQIFNEFSELESEPIIVPWSELLVSAPRKVVVASIDKTPRETSKRIAYKLKGDVQAGIGTKDLEVVSKNGTLCFSEAYMENRLLSELDFCVVRIVHLQIPKKESSLEGNIQQYIYSDWDPKKTTVVLTQWSGNIWAQNTNAFDRVNCSDPEWSRIQHRLVPSKRLLKDAQFYIRRHFHSSKFTAMMVRSVHVVSGHLLRSNGNIKNLLDYVKSCLQSAIETAYGGNDTQQNGEPNRGIFLTLDVGKEGTTDNKLSRLNLLGQSIDRVVRDLVGDVFSHKLSFGEWENSFVEASGGLDSPAYVAALQRTIASQSDCLILVGGGNFQMLATIEYLRLHPNPQEQCVHMLCFKDWFTPIFSSHLSE